MIIQLGNELLARLPNHVRSDLDAVCENVELRLGEVLERPGKEIACCYFVDNGFISVVAEVGASRAEVGMIGREGCTAMAFVLGARSSPNTAMVQGAGSGQRVSVALLRSVMDGAPALTESLLKYAHVFVVQGAQTALSNGYGTVPQRLARWLLMANDRIDGNELHLTHEFMSMMLTVRRAGVTEALHILEAAKVIKSERGVVTVRDRDGLIEMADGTYGIPEAEYVRLFPSLPSQKIDAVTIVDLQ